MTFDLAIYTGLEKQNVLNKNRISLDPDIAVRIRPSNWNPATIAQSSVQLDVINLATRTMVRQVRL